MSGNSDGDLTRLFAHAPVIDADDAFLAKVATDVAARRRGLRYRRVLLVASLCVVAAVLAVLLAPLAPSFDSVSALGDSLLVLPDRIGTTAAHISAVPGAPYLACALLAVLLPLAGVAWLSRRA